MAGEREKIKNFKDLAGQAGIKKATLDKLVAEDFDTVDAVKLMSPDDITTMDITKGQLRLLQQWVKSMNDDMPTTAASTSEHEEPDDVISTARTDGRADADLFLPGDAMDTWNNDDISSQNTGKVHYIHDLVSRMSHDDNERAVCSQGGTQLILRSTRPKLAPESVSLAQWISANARIMSKLISEGNLKSNSDIQDYLQYTMDFGDYAQVNELPSVMTYDHEYRRKQSVKSRAWGADDIHLANFYLVRKRDSQRTRPTSTNHSRPPRLVDTSGTEICRNFNGNWCYRESCVFSHVCMVCKQAGHSRRSHRDQQRTQTGNGSFAGVQPRGNPA